MSDAPELLEHFFRHEYGNLVSLLAGRIGVSRLADIEDAAQSALMTALQTWPINGIPENPSAWLYTVARNKLLSDLRAGASRSNLLHKNADQIPPPPHSIPESFLPQEIPDELLRMLFLCCDESVPEESQLVLALKILCGFGVKEIALGLFTSEANVYKRLERAKEKLREIPLKNQEPTSQHYAARLPSVLKILYLLFNEGYLSTASESAIRKDLCSESIRLATLLANHPIGKHPQAAALIALFLLHDARSSGRTNASGGLVLLEDQDRTTWNREKFQQGLRWLALSATGSNFSRYHAEAGIAAEHCLSPSFQQTRWDRIIACYDILETESPSPIHTLNRAVALAELKGPAAALESLQKRHPPTWLVGSYLWSAVLGDLQQRIGSKEIADRYQKLANSAAPTPTIRAALELRFTQNAVPKPD